MITTVKDFFWSLLLVVCALLAAFGIVVALNAVLPPARSLSPTEANYRAICDAAKGNAVWNGRHWDCIK